MGVNSLPAKPPGEPKNTGVGSPIPFPADLPDPGIEPGSSALQVDSLPTEIPGQLKAEEEMASTQEAVMRIK